MPFLGPGVGGSHMSGLILAEGLRQRYDLKTAILAPKDARVTELAREKGIDAVDSGMPPTTRRYDPLGAVLGTFKRLQTLKKLAHQAVLHVNDLSALQIWGPAARLLRMPIIYHDRAAGRAFPKKVILRLANHIITVSEFCYERLSYVPRHRKTLITDPFKVPLDLDGAAARKGLLLEMQWPESCKLIGFSGNFWRRKRPTYFLDVCGELRARDSSLRFVMFGRGGDFSSEEMGSIITARKLEDVVLLAGFRTPAERNIASLDLLLVPALKEPFGRTPVEALLLGVPYVATCDAGHIEILRRWGGGRGVAPDADYVTFADAAHDVLRAAEKTALSPDRCREIAEELSPVAHAEAVMAIYQRFMRNRSAASGPLSSGRHF